MERQICINIIHLHCKMQALFSWGYVVSKFTIEQYVVRWPFILKENTGYDPFVGPDSYEWVPGWHNESDDQGQSWLCSHDGEGWMVLDVVSRHRPTPKHMERVFLYRRLYDPFGSPIFTKPKFICITQGGLEKYFSGRKTGHTLLNGDYADKFLQIEPFIKKDLYLEAALKAERKKIKDMLSVESEGS